MWTVGVDCGCGLWVWTVGEGWGCMGVWAGCNVLVTGSVWEKVVIYFLNTFIQTWHTYKAVITFARRHQEQNKYKLHEYYTDTVQLYAH